MALSRGFRRVPRGPLLSCLWFWPASSRRCAKRPALEVVFVPSFARRPRAAAGDHGAQAPGNGEDVFQVRGDKPERWVRQTDFANDEAVFQIA